MDKCCAGWGKVEKVWTGSRVESGGVEGLGGDWTGGRRIGPESIDRSGGSEEPVYVGIGVK